MDSTQMDPLANLRDVHLPDPVSVFPLAPVWYVLISFIVFGLIICSIWQIRLYYKRKKMSFVNTMLDDIINNPDKETLNKINILLKRVAIEKFPQSQSHTLYGDKWIEFLDKTGKTDQFTNGVGRVLGSAYVQNIQLNQLDDLKEIVNKWLRVVI